MEYLSLRHCLLLQESYSKLKPSITKGRSEHQSAIPMLAKVQLGQQRAQQLPPRMTAGVTASASAATTITASDAQPLVEKSKPDSPGGVRERTESVDVTASMEECHISPVVARMQSNITVRRSPRAKPLAVASKNEGNYWI